MQRVVGAECAAHARPRRGSRRHGSPPPRRARDAPRASRSRAAPTRSTTCAMLSPPGGRSSPPSGQNACAGRREPRRQLGMRQPLPFAEALLDQARLDGQRLLRVAGAEDRLGGGRVRDSGVTSQTAGRGRRRASAAYIGRCASRLCGHSSHVHRAVEVTARAFSSTIAWRISQKIRLGPCAYSPIGQGGRRASRAARNCAANSARRRREPGHDSAPPPRPVAPAPPPPCCSAVRMPSNTCAEGSASATGCSAAGRTETGIEHGGERRHAEQHRPGQRLGARAMAQDQADHAERNPPAHHHQVDGEQHQHRPQREQVERIEQPRQQQRRQRRRSRPA